MKKKLAVLASLAATLFAVNSPANASVIFQTGNNPQNNEENILFNGAGTIAGPATTVVGRTNHTHTLVSFTSTDTLITDAMGQSRIEAVDGEFRDLSVYLTQGGTFGDLIFNLNTPNRLTGTALITVNLLTGPAATYDLALSNGQNFLTLYTTGTDRITSVDISSNTGMTAIDIDDARQIRISDIQPPPTDVPEPATLGLLAAGLLGMGQLTRKRNKST